MTPWGKRTAWWLVAGVLLASATALAEDPKARAAREDLERQLKQLVGKAPTRVRVELEALDEPNYALEEVSFEIDGRSLGAPPLAQLNREGTHLVWSGDVAPGKHAVAVRLVYANRTSVVLSDEGGYSWKIGGTVSFDVNAGIEVQVRVVPKRDSTQADIAKRFRLSLPAKPVMLAALDDGTMPEPPPKPVLAAADAGPTPEQLAAAEAQAKAQAAAEAARLAAEEKQRKADEAAEAKRLAAEEKQRKADEAAEAKRLAAEAKQQKADAVAEAKRLAAAEKQRLADEAAEARRLAAAPKVGPPAATAVEPSAPLAEDAGPALAAAEPVPDAGPAPTPEPVATAPAPAPAPTEDEAFPWPLAAGAGALGLVVFLALLARRRARPPSLDD